LTGDRRTPFGAICWTPLLGLDEAITMVRGLDDRDEAISLASSRCGSGECWAVVDLASMRVVARGNSSR